MDHVLDEHDIDIVHLLPYHLLGVMVQADWPTTSTSPACEAIPGAVM